MWDSVSGGMRFYIIELGTFDFKSRSLFVVSMTFSNGKSSFLEKRSGDVYILSMDAITNFCVRSFHPSIAFAESESSISFTVLLKAESDLDCADLKAYCSKIPRSLSYCFPENQVA